MTRNIKKIFIAIGAVGILLLVAIVWRYGPARWPAFFPAPKDITKYLPSDAVPPGALNETDLPLRVAAGFRISIFAKDLPGARVILFDSFGNLWVSRTSAGVISTLEIKDGRVTKQHDVFRGLKNPHGLAVDPDHPSLLYIAEEDNIQRVTLYSDDPGEEVIKLPAGGGHTTRTIVFGPDKKLYIAVGSSCDVCYESDGERAAILRYDPQTKKLETFARGLRNSVFFQWDQAGRLWATEMGRDWLGDNLPPDEINLIEERRNYGWPECYGKNILDTNFHKDDHVHIRAHCAEPFEYPSAIDLPAHSAPLGLAIIPTGAKNWPPDFANDMLVAYHGSWNRSQPTGYKIVRHRFDDAGQYQGVEDFITGWLTPEGALGRPVDLALGPDGMLYVSDDKAGVIYKIEPIKK